MTLNKEENTIESLKTIFHDNREKFSVDNYVKILKLFEDLSTNYTLKGVSKYQQKANKTYYNKVKNDPVFKEKQRMNNRISFLKKKLKTKLTHYAKREIESEINYLNIKKKNFLNV